MEDLVVKYVAGFLLLKEKPESLVQLIMELQRKNSAFNDRVIQLQQEKLQLQQQMQVKDQEHRNLIAEFEERYNIAKMESEKHHRIANLKLGEAYNIKASWIDKIVFVLKEAQRPLRSAEIIQILNNNDYVFRETVQDKTRMLSHYTARALRYGRIYGEKNAGKNGYLLSLPEE